MTRKSKFIFKASLSIILIAFVFGFYGWYMPNYIIEHKTQMEEVLEMNGFKPIEMLEVSGFYATATWKVAKPDSIGNMVEKTVEVQLDKGHWFVNP